MHTVRCFCRSPYQTILYTESQINWAGKDNPWAIRLPVLVLIIRDSPVIELSDTGALK